MENTVEKVCPNCGERLPGDSFFCVKCGTKIGGEAENVEVTKPTGFFAKNKRNIGISVGVVIGILAIIFIINSVQASNLKKELERDWAKVEGDDGAYILCVLDFSDDEIEYRLETGYAWMDTTVATYDYKVVSGNKIKVLRYGDDWETITVEFNDDKTMMTVKPALTSIEDKEYWFNLD